MDEISIDDAFQNKRDQNKERINTTIRDYADYASIELEESMNENLLLRLILFYLRDKFKSFPFDLFH